MNTTEGTTQQTDKGPTLIEVVRAFEQEMSQMRREHYELARKVSRYDRMFERMFREEVENRLCAKDDNPSMGCESRLSSLRMNLEHLDEMAVKKRMENAIQQEMRKG